MIVCRQVQQESHEEVVPAMHGTAGAAFHRQDEVVDGVEAPGTDPVKTEPSQETPLQPVDAENHLDGTESTSSLPVPKYRMNEPGDGENATATAMTPTAPEDDVGITAATNQSTAVTNRSVVSLTSTAADQSDEYPVEEDAGKDKERDAVWNAYAQGRWVNGQWVPKVGSCSGRKKKKKEKTPASSRDFREAQKKILQCFRVLKTHPWALQQ